MYRKGTPVMMQIVTNVDVLVAQKEIFVWMVSRLGNDVESECWISF